MFFEMSEHGYSKSAIERARDIAFAWLERNGDGYPRSWNQEADHTKRRGYEMYDDFEAPPIAGYEALEREGLVERLETVVQRGDERIHFKLITTTACEVGESSVTEAIDHPDHYGGADNPYEAIKVIEAWGLGFHLGNAVKYVSRAGKKGDELEDLKKARWYLNRCIAQLEKAK